MARAERVERGGGEEGRGAKRRKREREGKEKSGTKLQRATGLVRVELVWKEAVPEHSCSEWVYCQIIIELQRFGPVGQLNPDRSSLGEKRRGRDRVTETTDRRDEREERRGKRAKGSRGMDFVLGFCFEADGDRRTGDWRLTGTERRKKSLIINANLV
ncbi:hypothetical protein BDV10DRAFT_81017 [Aspergillus recurvatus]